MKVILYQPQIPQNAGNIVRTCAVTNSDLVMVRPLGFATTDRWLKRAGLDYWEGVNVEIVDDLESLIAQAPANVFFFSSKASGLYTDVSYTAQDWLVFGSETEGLPIKFFKEWPQKFVTIPMKPGKRCLNLATSVGIAVYEAWRQQKFYG